MKLKALMLAGFTSKAMQAETSHTPPQSNPDVGTSSPDTTNTPLPEGGKKVKSKQEKQPTSGNVLRDKILGNIVYFVLIIMFIGVGTMFIAVITLYIQSFNSKEASYHELETQVQAQNATINAIAKKLNIQ